MPWYFSAMSLGVLLVFYWLCSCACVKKGRHTIRSSKICPGTVLAGVNVRWDGLCYGEKLISFIFSCSSMFIIFSSYLSYSPFCLVAVNFTEAL